MKKVWIYRCEICGGEYSSEDECKICETQHQKPVQVLKHKHAIGGRYPNLLQVEMSDGVSCYYSYVDRQRA